MEKWDLYNENGEKYVARYHEEFKHILGFIAYHLHVNNLYEISSNDLKTYLQNKYFNV